MSTSAYDELQLFAQEIQSFLSLNILQDLARDVGFVQRTSKYQILDPTVSNKSTTNSLGSSQL
ncbi:TPA: hypothetical protein ROY14_003427 [Bacillus mobilis]|uniref:hypothetical protein n=1 Tax=Bacillus mobilis TaxID=2026190 RepID=UPI0011A2F453|nr:hypothetical protein [Bacillus mobilis]MED4387496.1 hypothetical protein [Bacillus mobilis]HDX9641296.1 hypothetical protein [Bacillus mobilis]